MYKLNEILKSYNKIVYLLIIVFTFIIYHFVNKFMKQSFLLELKNIFNDTLNYNNYFFKSWFVLLSINLFKFILKAQLLK